MNSQTQGDNTAALQAKAPVQNSRFGWGRLLLCTVVAAFAGASNVDAQTGGGKIKFNYMYVHDDKEGGSGDWFVTARTSEGQSRALIENREAGTGGTLYIEREMTYQRFPFTVSVRVQEHDGGIGARWEEVGTRSVRVTGPGRYSVRVSNREGDVSVFFEVSASRPRLTGGPGPAKFPLRKLKK